MRSWKWTKLFTRRAIPASRWILRYGRYEGVEQFAVEELQRYLQELFPYVMTCQNVSQPVADSEAHQMIIGTPDSNAAIAAEVERGRLVPPSHKQGIHHQVAAVLGGCLGQAGVHCRQRTCRRAVRRHGLPQSNPARH